MIDSIVVSTRLTQYTANDHFSAQVLAAGLLFGTIALVGFVTNDGPPPVDDAVGEPVVNMFVPHSPNPTSGHLILLPEDELRRVDVSVRKALQILVTTGIAQDELPGGETIRLPAKPADD